MGLRVSEDSFVLIWCKMNMSQPGGNVVSGPIILVPADVIFQHGKHGTLSIFKAEFPAKSTILDLKHEMAPRLRTPAECQVWYYKNKMLSDRTTMGELYLQKNDKIVIREINPSNNMRQGNGSDRFSNSSNYYVNREDTDSLSSSAMATNETLQAGGAYKY